MSKRILGLILSPKAGAVMTDHSLTIATDVDDDFVSQKSSQESNICDAPMTTNKIECT